MTRRPEDQPATVPLAQQAGEIRSRWRWVEPGVWTVRMVTALEQGVKGAKWFRLFDKVFSERNLRAAFQQVATNEGALGYRFHGTERWPRDKSLHKLKDALRAKPRRTSGDSLVFLINALNRTLRGWFAYFQHCRPPWIFERLDRWIRVRLRSILRKRCGRRGRGRGLDHQRWPNRFFAEQGLYSLVTAHATAVQSSRR